jgi:acetyl-CoA carboxylase biotin carboxyl carrier protein
VGLTPDDLRELLDAFEGSTWQEMTVTVSGDSLHVSRRAETASAGAVPVAVAAPAPVAPTAASAPAATAGTAATSAEAPAPPPDPAAAGAGEPAAAGAAATAAGTPVPAPSVGLFWRAPSPGAPPFVDVGSRVAPEDTIGIVEVMKLMNRVPAGVAGVVTAVLVENGGMVEHGQPLVLIDTSA